MDYWRYLSLEECCFTCENNINAYEKNKKCACGKSPNNKEQDVYCCLYEMKEEEE